MLVLSRRLEEKIFIGENICITVVDIDRGKIRLGIQAPRNVPIWRQELGESPPVDPSDASPGGMLVLSRKVGEKVCIGENICITVIDIDRGKIRLGFEAPRDVPIYRQEILPIKEGTTPVGNPK